MRRWREGKKKKKKKQGAENERKRSRRQKRERERDLTERKKGLAIVLKPDGPKRESVKRRILIIVKVMIRR